MKSSMKILGAPLWPVLEINWHIFLPLAIESTRFIEKNIFKNPDIDREIDLIYDYINPVLEFYDEYSGDIFNIAENVISHVKGYQIGSAAEIELENFIEPDFVAEVVREPERPRPILDSGIWLISDFDSDEPSDIPIYSAI